MAIPTTRSPRAPSRAAATAGSQRTATRTTSNPASAAAKLGLAGGPSQEDLVENQPNPGRRDRRQTPVPGPSQRPVARRDLHLPAGPEGHHRVGPRRGQRLTEDVLTEREPGHRQQELQGSGDRGLPRTGPTVEHDDVYCHPPDCTHEESLVDFYRVQIGRSLIGAPWTRLLRHSSHPAARGNDGVANAPLSRPRGTGRISDNRPNPRWSVGTP